MSGFLIIEAMVDVIVIGGGVIGMMTARNLALRGASVTLIERGKLGAESSWAGGGIISALNPWQATPAINRLILWGHENYQALAEDLAAKTRLDPEWQRSGMLFVSGESELAEKWSFESGIMLEDINGSKLKTLSPELNADSAIYLPDVAQIRNPRLAKSLAISLKQLGVQVLENMRVDQIVVEQGQLKSIQSGKQGFSADKVVLAAGAWSAKLVPALAKKRILPVRGEMLLYKLPQGSLKQIIIGPYGYAIPRKDGHVLYGSTVEDVGFNKATTDGALKELTVAAEQLLPILNPSALVGHWAGLRPGSDNGVPVISSAPEIENLFINCGHFRNGIAMAPASAQLMADLVEGVKPKIEADDYALM